MADSFFQNKISISEFITDFFGGLIPGIIFILSVVAILIMPITLFFVGLEIWYFGESKFYFYILLFLEVVQNLHWLTILIIFFVFVMFSYFIGMNFYRRDPKDPDYWSFLKYAKQFNDGDAENWVVKVPADISLSETGFLKDKSHFNSKNVKKSHVQFPYNNFQQYLNHRGREKDLAKLIKWDWENEVGRSKTFINTLKIRLKFHFPDKCSTLIKNEAHVRLSSTMWYVAKSLTNGWYFGTGLLFSILTIIIFFTSDKPFNSLINIIPLAFVISTFIFFKIVKSKIEGFLHYQRVREIFFVLETAYNSKLKDSEILNGLE